ncbi:MAG: AraC family transcriptional regulator [Verrucomicrobia bacterium]|jgi:AraC-like DNA-binding protein|nr:AraC family transcriptional regulator [Verrucomicrobiota bacterium]
MSDKSQLSPRFAAERDAFFRRLRGGQLQQLFDHLPEVYFVVKNCEGRVVMANEVAVRLCGFSRESEMIGKTDYDIFARDRADIYVRDDRHVFETGESIVDRVEMAPDPSNSINWFVTTKIPLYAEEGSIIGLACIARNMTGAYEKLRPYTEMNQVLEYVRENHAQSMRIEDLANLVHLSPSQFERRFRKVFHITPTRHILNVRLRAACNRLTSTNDTIAAIAQSVGFYDQSHFSRNFKKVMGVAPGEYRQQGRKSPW